MARAIAGATTLNFDRAKALHGEIIHCRIGPAEGWSFAAGDRACAPCEGPSQPRSRLAELSSLIRHKQTRVCHIAAWNFRSCVCAM
jgi:hypothetical protein